MSLNQNPSTETVVYQQDRFRDVIKKDARVLFFQELILYENNCSWTYFYKYE
jgi:hypothetical protein